MALYIALYSDFKNASYCVSFRSAICRESVIAGKWTLLVVRDLRLHGQRIYKELPPSWQKMPTNIFSQRLKKLEAIGIINKQPNQQRPLRNHDSLTKKGLALTPVHITRD